MFCGRILGNPKRSVDPRYLLYIGASLFLYSMWKLAHLTPQSGEPDTQLALLIRGFGMGLMYTPINNAAFGNLKPSEAQQASGLINLSRQIGGSFGIAILGTYVTNKAQFHRVNMIPHVYNGNTALIARQQGLAGTLVHHGYSAAQAHGISLGLIDHIITQQAQTMSYNDGFLLILTVFLCVSPFMLLLRKPNPAAKGAPRRRALTRFAIFAAGGTEAAGQEGPCRTVVVTGQCSPVLNVPALKRPGLTAFGQRVLRASRYNAVMRITGVRLQNIACFEDLSLDFTNENSGEAAPWVVILGGNGCGKSTLLQMICGAYLSESQFAGLVGAFDPEAVFRVLGGSFLCTVSVNIETSDETESLKDRIETIQFGYMRHKLFPNSPAQYSTARHINEERNRIYDSLTQGGPLICGYGSSRALRSMTITDRSDLRAAEGSDKPSRFASILGDGSGMTRVADWLVGLYFATLHPDHQESDERRFEIARVGVLGALPGISKLTVTKEQQVIVTEGDTRVPLERLSDGYRGTLAWIGDLIRRLFDAYPDSDNPLKESGVVLVDEIDLHLHPKWQRSVVEDVRKLFPNLQFIVTSHSPFVAQDMRPEDKIIVLERSGKDGKGPVVAREENGSLESWSADQILSDYFGLEDGTRGTKTQKAEQRFVRLLGAEAAGKLTARQAQGA